jgi:hypothetical protein
MKNQLSAYAWLYAHRSTKKVVDAAIKTNALNCGHDGVERWAKKWLSGEDKTSASAWHASVNAGDESRLAMIQAEKEYYTSGGELTPGWKEAWEKMERLKIAAKIAQAAHELAREIEARQ